MHVASSARIFFSYNRSQDFVFLDKFPLQEFSFFLGIITPPPVISNGPSLNKPLFNTCHTVSVLLPFVVQRLFWRFLLNVKWENIKKIAQHSRLANICILAKKRQRQLYCSEKTTATFVSTPANRRQVDWKMSDKATSEPAPWKASPMWSEFKSRRRLQTWLQFAVGSLPCFERFFSGYSGFPFSSKTNTSKFQFYLERTDTFKRVYKNS